MSEPASEIQPGDVQHSLFGGETRRRRPEEACPNPASTTSKTHDAEASVEPYPPTPGLALSPVVSRMYVTPCLQSVVLTGHEIGMPADETQTVFDGDDTTNRPASWKRLTRELFDTICRQLDDVTPRELGAERTAVMLARWEVVYAWARGEGWT